MAGVHARPDVKRMWVIGYEVDKKQTVCVVAPDKRTPELDDYLMKHTRPHIGWTYDSWDAFVVRLHPFEVSLDEHTHMLCDNAIVAFLQGLSSWTCPECKERGESESRCPCWFDEVDNKVRAGVDPTNRRLCCGCCVGCSYDKSAGSPVEEGDDEKQEAKQDSSKEFYTVDELLEISFTGLSGILTRLKVPGRAEMTTKQKKAEALVGYSAALIDKWRLYVI